MYETEAADKLKPQQEQKEGKQVKSLNGYFWVICILFASVMALCINNFIVYKTYTKIRSEYSITVQKLESTAEGKQSLSEEKQLLLDENASLSEKMNAISKQNEEIQKQIQEIKKQNDELTQKNKELVDDNIALQNSLKMAASAGVKPQSYKLFDGLSSRSGIDRGKYIGKFLGTAYTPSKEECGNNKGITNSGEPIIPGISVAIDNKYWPFGTVFYIKGLGYAIAMDTGSAIKGKYRFDFSVLDKKFADTLGSRQWDVYLVKLGKGDVNGIKL